MGAEVSVTAVLVEQEDGSYKASCPELAVNAEGESSEEAFENLKADVAKKVREAGAAIELSPVKCLKFKVSVEE